MGPSRGKMGAGGRGELGGGLGAERRTKGRAEMGPGGRQELKGKRWELRVAGPEGKDGPGKETGRRGNDGT